MASAAPVPLACSMIRCSPPAAGRASWRRFGEQAPGDLGGRPQPLLLPARVRVEPGLVHRGARRRRQRDDQGLVVFVEGLAGALVREVQVAVNDVADLHGRSEERPHRRMTWREARGVRVSGDIWRPQRLRPRDQLTEQPFALRPVIDRDDLGFVKSDRDEFGKPAVLSDHAKRTVPGVHKLHGGLGDAPQHGLEFHL